jgi:DNA-binding Xre family transcriptional regulator
MNVNRAIRAIMAEKGIKATELAKATGLHSSKISRAIGVGCNPKVSILVIMAEQLNVKVSDIIIRAESLDNDQ